MGRKISLFSNIANSYSATLKSIQKNPRIFIPFAIFGALELAVLVFLYLAPRMPLRTFMGPLIVTLWGERFLHYPQNFLLLPKLAFIARMGLTVVFGSLLTAIAVALLYKKKMALAFKKYANVLVVIFLLTTIYYVMNKLVFILLVKYFSAGHEKFLFIGPRWWLGPFGVAISQVLALVLQSVFSYAVPILLLTEKKFIGAIAGSFQFFIRNIMVTLLLVAIPMLISLPIICLNYNGTYLMATFSPEIMLWLGVLGALVNSLILDPMITLATAAFYLEKRDK